MKKLFTLLAILAVTAAVPAFASDTKSAEPKAAAKVEKVAEKSAKKSDDAKPYTEISAEELQKLQSENKHLVLIDSRGGKYFDGTVIKGAKQLSTDDTNEKTLAKLAPKKADVIVFYCTSHECPASAKAAGKAKELGYTNILKYGAGIEEWVKKGLPTETVKADLNK